MSRLIPFRPPADLDRWGENPSVPSMPGGFDPACFDNQKQSFGDDTVSSVIRAGQTYLDTEKARAEAEKAKAQAAATQAATGLQTARAGIGTATPWVIGIIALGVLWTIFGGKE